MPSTIKLNLEVMYDQELSGEVLRAVRDALCGAMDREVGNGLLTNCAPELTVHSYTIAVELGPGTSW
jgi:hypothetical protein